MLKRTLAAPAFLHDHPGCTFVPGHGGIRKASNVTAFRDYLETLRKDVAAAQAAGESGDALIAAVLPELQKGYDDRGWFKYFVRHNIEQTAAELRGTKQVPVPGKP